MQIAIKNKASKIENRKMIEYEIKRLEWSKKSIGSVIKYNNSDFDEDTPFDEWFMYIEKGSGNNNGDDEGDAIPNNEIWYTTSDGNIVTNYYNIDGLELLSNTYEDGVGKLVYDGDITTITDRSFLGTLTKLTSVILPDTLETVGISFLINCTGLTSIKLPKSLTTVGNSFLSGCNKLESIDLSNTKLESTGTSFIYNCTSLTSIKLPDTLTTVDKSFLNSCKALTSVDLSNTKLETVNGGNFLFSCTSMTSVKLPNTITSFDTNQLLYNNRLAGVLYYPSSKVDDFVYDEIIMRLPSTWTAETYS